MPEAVTALLDRGAPIPVELWRALWDTIEAGELDGPHSAALLASLATELPGDDSLAALLGSLRERRPAGTAWPGTVNVVGTGGGPKTFNVSTASAFVAAAAGVRVVKTGSRAYTSSLGSIDLLERLGVRPSATPAGTAQTLERFGIAFAGGYVYPPVLGRLARSIRPMGMKSFGRFLNALGPFMAALPVAAQVTGVSATMPQERLRRLAATVTDRRIWLCTNGLGADELLPFTDNTVHTPDGPVELPRGGLVAGDGSLDDLAPAAPPDAPAHFAAVLAGRAGPVALGTVCLNAAALAVAAGTEPDWAGAVARAEDAVHSGAAVNLLNQLRAGLRMPAVAHA